MNAAAISRRLRRDGFNPVAASDRNRQGLRVKNSGAQVRVTADLNSDREAQALATDAYEALVGDYDLRRVEANAFYVYGRREAPGAFTPQGLGIVR